MTRVKIDGLETWVTAFLRDCKMRGLSAFTIEFYRAQLQIFVTYCNGESVNEVLDITSDTLRGFMLVLETKGRNAGRRHTAFRAALRSAEADMLDTVTWRLTAGQVLAQDTLEKLIQSPRDESTKLTACVSWLNMFIKYHDMKDIEERLTALEAAIHDKK